MKAIARSSRINLIQLLAWGYAAMFLFVVSLGYIPGLTNSQGRLLGLFRIELIDDALHLTSAIWAAAAAWTSVRASTLYFKLFGTIYFLDGLLGLITGQGYLDGGIFINGPAPFDLATKIAANAPHLAIGGAAIFIGFVLSRTYGEQV